MDPKRVRMILQALPLLLPINVYMIGDWLGTGLQWALVRYQETYLGTSIIPVTKDISYVLSGIMTGRSGASIIVWCIATVLLVVALALVLYSPAPGDWFRHRRYAPYITISAAILFLVSCMLQYGVSLHGTAGFSIPLGVPIIIVIGYWTYRLDAAGEPVSSNEIAADGS